MGSSADAEQRHGHAVGGPGRTAASTVGPVAPSRQRTRPAGHRAALPPAMMDQKLTSGFVILISSK